VRRGDGDALYFAGRSADILRIGSENVAAAEIERVAAEVPGVLEVAAVGRPDRLRGEVPVLFIRVSGPAASIMAAVRAQCAQKLAGFKLPAEIRVVQDFPRTSIQKIAKPALREEAAKLEPRT
jgi:carnitine-CoA ligase